LERVTAMMAAGEHLLGMVNAVLDVARIEADRLELHLVRIEMPDFARACLDVVRPTAAAKGLALLLTVPASLALLADATRLRQIIINPRGNAIKFTPAGSFELRTAEAGNWLRLE
jgi:signal transduction histidine kinase